jgi:ribosomal protein S8
MTEAQAARFLIEELPQQLDKAGADEKMSAVANRIALQIFSVPSLQSFLADYAVVSTGRDDGSVKVQLDFLKLPKEIVPELEKLLSVDMFKDHKLVKYIKNGQARTGLEIEVTPKDLPGTSYDYAF